MRRLDVGDSANEMIVAEEASEYSAVPRVGSYQMGIDRALSQEAGVAMKKPGRQKRRPPGGGAAGRAQQFEFQRDIDKQGSEGEAPKISSQTKSSKKQTKKKQSSAKR